MNRYIEENRWYITASKLKYFITYWPEAYKLKYIDEIPAKEIEAPYFLMWNAFDDLVSFGEDFFQEKYYIDEWLLKADLIERLWDKCTWKEKVSELQDMYYWEKIRLTQSQWDQILGMYAEAKRQPLADLWWEYSVQEAIICEYNWLKLRMKLDRFSLEKWLIRDRKTTLNFSNYEYKIEEVFDYVLSMAFYYVWVRVKYDKQCDVILDVLSKTAPHPYIAYKLDKNTLYEKVVHKIKPALDYLKICIETNTRESVYPITYHTTDQYGSVVTHNQWEPIHRTQLMKCDHYWLMKWTIAHEFVTPMF